MEEMIGGVPEIDSHINSVPCKSLLDTGSQITTISVSFYDKHLTSIPIQSCHSLLRVEGVGGDKLPYHGYIVCEVTVPLTDTTTFSSIIPVLVVPDTTYNSTTPCLIGTNFLSKIPNNQTPLSSMMPHIKSAIQILQLRSQQLEKSNGVYSSVYADQATTVPPFTSIMTTGKSTITVSVRQQLALVLSHPDIPVIPGVAQVTEGDNIIPLEVVNYSDKPIHISVGQEMAVLHQASLAPITFNQNEPVDTDKFLASFDYSHLSEQEGAELKTFLCKNRDVFAMSHREMGCTNRVTHNIELLDETPFKDKCRPIPPSAYDELREHLAELTSAGIITESKSPFSSNIVMARKKDGSLRLCVDYRKLNSRTKKDAYNIPRTDILIDSCQGSKYFASLDLFSGYHQVAMEPKVQERTAFSVGPLGFYQYTRMPFGLCNSPSTFQRLMEQVLEGLTMVKCAVYIDDIIVFASTREQLYSNLSEVFDRLRQAHLTLKPSKCEFFRTSVEFLGHTVSQEGVACSKKHIEAVTSWPEPTDVSELQTFLGFTGFYRRFIPGYSTVASPMLKLLKGSEHPKKIQKSGKKGRIQYVPWEWGIDQQEAFEKLKTSLTSAPILIYPDYRKPFTLHVDACRRGLGAVLYQEQADKKLHVVAYASRSLTGSEKNYTVHKLEFLALKWAITTKFHHYLYGQTFSVFTDHNPLVYVTSTAKLDANGHRWLESLASYNFTIHYKPGKTHSDADGLSRRPHPETEERQCSKIISPEIFKEICALVSGDQEFAGVAESLGLSPIVMSNATRASYPVSIDWAAEQDRDLDTARVKDLVHKRTRPSDRQRKAESPVTLRLLSHWDSLTVKNGVLFKISKLGDEVMHRVIIPAHKQNECLSLVHDDLGHLGRDKTLSVAQERFYWVGLTKDVETKIKTCHRCICAKSPNLPEKAPLTNIITARPMELVCMDFLSLETAVGGYNSILVVTDHFTRYACAFPTRNQEARTVAKVLMEEYFVHYGIPERLHSDQGANFQGRVISHLCKLLGIKKSRTTPYHPQGDGMTERFNKTLISMLKTLDPSQKPRWREHVASLVHAYNCCRHESTQHTPFYLMFGRQPRLAIDVFLGLDPDYTSSVESIKQRLEAAYKAASEAAIKASKRQSKNYNRTVRGHGLDVGDQVLIRNVGLKGKHKLADKWQQEPFMVVAKPNPDIPVYRIKRGTETKVIHRNLLLPVSLPFDFSASSTDTGNTKGSTSAEQEMEEESDDELQFWVHEVPTLGENLQADQRSQPTQRWVAQPETLVPRSLSGNYGYDVELPTVGQQDNISDLDNSQLETAGGVLFGEEGDAPMVQEDPPDIPEPTGLRRSQRTRQPPVRYGDYVVAQNLNALPTTVSDWRDRLSILLLLINIFPAQQAEIFNAIIRVITVVQ